MLLLGCVGVVRAHPEGFSGLRVHVWPERVRVIASIHTRDMTAWFPPGQNLNYVADVMGKMRQAPGEIVEVRIGEKVLEPTRVEVAQAEVGLIDAEMWYELPAGAGEFEVWSKCLIKLPSGHQQLAFVEDMRGLDEKVLSGHAMKEDVLTRDHDSIVVEVVKERAATQVASTHALTPALSRSTGRGGNATEEQGSRRISFFALGVEHIVTGYDHLLFLAALLLVCKTFREAAAVITFFTVAHSITLSLAALDIVRLPGRIVEPVIAASIIYVGLENVFGRHRFVWRALVTFGFGLVHGLGFASALREVGLGSTSMGVAWPLVKFSVGLETGQLVIAAILLKVLLWMRSAPTFEFERRWVPAGSVAVAVVGTYWLVTRVMAG
jgi:hydrogenase/urease accessory protein HupE